MLYIARHGRTIWTGLRYCGRSDPPLDARGRRDAARLAHDLAGVVAAGAPILTSPLRRARDSASIVARGRRVECDPRLAEVDLGRADGLTFRELEAHWPAVAIALLAGDGLVDWPDGESASDVRARVRTLCAELRALGDAIVVTHGFVARAIALEFGADLPFLLPGRMRALPS